MPIGIAAARRALLTKRSSVLCFPGDLFPADLFLGDVSLGDPGMMIL
jgi:hypothetical protein